MLHHVEIWVPDIDRARASWGWLLEELGYEVFQDWPGGVSWMAGDTYLVFEQSAAMTAADHDRLRAGLNHVAFHAGSTDDVDRLRGAAPDHGWTELFADRYPYAGGGPTELGPGHYAAYLENADGFEVELVGGP